MMKKISSAIFDRTLPNTELSESTRKTGLGTVM